MINKFGVYGCLLLISLFALIGCNTIEGAGKDLESAGEEIQEEAD